MKISDFELYRDLLLRYSGLALTQEKSYLLDSRLTPVARKWGYPTLDSMTLTLRGVPDPALVQDIIESIMNTDTSFFRDMSVFQTLKSTIIPHVMKTRGRKKDIHIWSAGCSTGQEVYSIALTLKNMETMLKGWRVDILGTDLSADALSRAASAEYTQFEVQRGLPVADLIAHFIELDNTWKLQPDIARLATFEHFNLLEPMDEFGLFDVIFCRNVLGDFEPRLRQTILNRLADQLDDHGVLILGAGEIPAGDLPPSLAPLPDFPGFYGHSERLALLPSLKKDQAIA